MKVGIAGAGRRLGVLGLGVALVLGLAACSEEPKQVFQRTEKPPTVVSDYDASLEPSAAVLPLVPGDAARLEVTDFDQLRLALGFGNLRGSSPVADRERFAREIATTAALTTGRLRPDDERLRSEFGIGQDDVSWEADWSGSPTDPAAAPTGWVVAFHDDVAMASVERAVRAGVGGLRGGVVDVGRRLVGVGLAPDPAGSWGAQEKLVRLVGRTAAATYVERGCVPFDQVYGAGMQAQLATAPALRLRRLDALDAFAVALGAELATVQLGPSRADAFDRARLADVMPATVPELGEVLTRPVADPSTGRIGYTLLDPPAAARLVGARTLPFAVCPG